MEVDDFVKGVAAALLNDLLDDKTGLAYKVSGVVAVIGFIAAVVADGWLRWLAVLVVILTLVVILFVFVTKRLAKGVINRFAPPVDIGNARTQFETAVAEADIPTGPASFMRLVWRLRKGVGPEVERLTGVVNQLRSGIDPG